MEIELVDAQVSPTTGRMEVLSKAEAAKLFDRGHGGLHALYRNCSLAVLSCGNELDDGKELLERYRSFDVGIIQRRRGIKLDIKGAPASAFVDGRMIKGIQEHLFAVLRDVIYVSNEISGNPRFDFATADGVTDAVFHILRNAGVLKPVTDPNLVVCWGGHSIGREEYDYTKKVGYELGLRRFDICTGCGPGAMKGPMKGAAIAHAKQRIGNGRYLGFTEPGIVAAEAPNPIVNELVILPDVEKRLEAFVRTGHGIVVFPGGVGTMEEILYVLGILLHPGNAELPFPLVFTGPKSSQEYFERIDRFIGTTLRWAPRRRSTTRSSSTTPCRWPARSRPACGWCAASARTSGTPTTSTGCCASSTSSSALSTPATRRCATSSCTAASRCTCWRPTCAAPSRAWSPATSRTRASA